MAVPCSTCGRTYDVALFQFGRTIDCTCGARVGIEPREAPPPGPTRLFADAMLGRLARWLRILGHDTAFDADIADGDLVRRCIEEGRVLLTRDRRLMDEWRVPRALLLRAEDPNEQLRETVTRLDLSHEGPLFSRCTVCNAPVERVDREHVRDQVPERVWHACEVFVRCPSCGRIYWEGTHTRRIRERLDGLLGSGSS
jgi:uncharacterized protein with PIN domain